MYNLVVIGQGGSARYMNSAVSTDGEDSYYNIGQSTRGLEVGDLRQFLASHSLNDYVKLFKVSRKNPID